MTEQLVETSELEELYRFMPHGPSLHWIQSVSLTGDLHCRSRVSPTLHSLGPWCGDQLPAELCIELFAQTAALGMLAAQRGSRGATWDRGEPLFVLQIRELAVPKATSLSAELPLVCEVQVELGVGNTVIVNGRLACEDSEKTFATASVLLGRGRS